MPRSIPLTRFPAGIPTYRSRHGQFIWPATLGPTALLHDDFDLLWVQQGQASMDLPNGRRLIADPGELIVLPPLLAGTINQSAGRLVFWYCHFDFRAQADATTRPVPMKIAHAHARPITSAYSALNAIDPQQPLAAWHREAALIRMIAELTQLPLPRGAGHAPEARPATHDLRVIALRQRIEANPAAPWRVDELAQTLDVSPGHLHAMWVATLGCAPKAYIVRARLRHAMTALRDTTGDKRQSIKEIAAAAGFSSQHLFTRQFQKTFGLTPTAFRNSAGL